MRAAQATEYGPPENLQIVEVDDPQPGAGEVVVDIEAAAVNFPDLLILNNSYQLSWPLPLIPGSELAGRIAEVGPGIEGLAVGDRVGAAVAVGAFADRIAVPAAGVWAVPDGVDTADAAAFRVTYLTSYHALRSVAAVEPGDVVVVLGAAGGVGSAAVDIAVLLGARVLAAVSNPDKAAACLARGAEAAIDYSREDLKQRIKELTGGSGADIVIDPVGGALAEPALRAMAWGGRFVTVGYASSVIPRIPLNLVLLKGVTVKGIEIRTFAHHRPDLAARDAQEMFDHLSAGRLRPLIGARYPLERTAEALRRVADRDIVGKVVISSAMH